MIAKVFMNGGYIDLEEMQLDLLRNYALVEVPELYGKSHYALNGFNDILFMEFVNGVSASEVKITNSLEKERFCNQVVENLLSIHQANNPSGFGSLTESLLSPCGEDYYEQEIDKLYHKLQLGKTQKSSSDSMKLADVLYNSFERVFRQPVKSSTLIYGDCNLWNLIADPNKKQIIGMIDPMGCSYADKGLDLFQLENANGKEYGCLNVMQSRWNLDKMLFSKTNTIIFGMM